MSLAAPLSEKEILDGADGRIQRHRTAEAVVRVLDADGNPLKIGTDVRVEQTRHDFLFGCNIFVLGKLKTPELNAAYEKHFAGLLNYATLPFYWWAYEKEAGEPDHARIGEIAEWCKAHDITMKGHPLAWNYYDPKWIPQDIELARMLQMARIFREVERFEGTIDIWDVVNEATAYDRVQCWKQAPVMTRIIRETGVGPYVRQAFAAARAANPDATLVINDYEHNVDYTTKVLNELLDDDRQPLFDVIGLQSHQHGGALPVLHLWQVCERFAAYGKPLHWTENTFVSGKQGWNLAEAEPGFEWESTPEGEKRQAEDATRFYTVLFSHPAVEAITWWDFADGMAWQAAPAGLIDKNGKPKPAYNALKDLIKGKWWTTTTAKTGEDGSVKFRGFFGKYKLTVPSADAEKTATFGLHKTTEGPIEVRLK